MMVRKRGTSTLRHFQCSGAGSGMSPLVKAFLPAKRPRGAACAWAGVAALAVRGTGTVTKPAAAPVVAALTFEGAPVGAAVLLILATPYMARCSNLRCVTLRDTTSSSLDCPLCWLFFLVRP
ncbi:hypothetical protein BV20DRAFT_819801 [Pilatotrama ljubarskyi]|nr:hypothetical protein BV20DRAFT_819801 [Pilatotrama ljubarskyi]